MTTTRNEEVLPARFEELTDVCLMAYWGAGWFGVGHLNGNVVVKKLPYATLRSGKSVLRDMQEMYPDKVFRVAI